MKYWMTQYHIDGFRFDQAKGFTQKPSTDDATWSAYDASRVAIWKRYDAYIKSLDPSFYVILEYFAGNQEESELAASGMMMMWTNLSNPAEQALMGYPDGNGTWDLSGLFYDRYGFTNPYGLVAYFESHDQERLQFKNETYGNSAGNYHVADLSTGLKRDAMGAAFLFCAPGPKMLWQFGERGYDISINANGRLGDKDPHWEYMADADRRGLYQAYATMIHMKTHNAVFTTTRFQYSLAGAVKTIQLMGDDGTDVELVGNFDVVSRSAVIGFPATGKWVDNISGTSLTVSAMPFTMTLASGEYHLYSNGPLKKIEKPRSDCRVPWWSCG